MSDEEASGKHGRLCVCVLEYACYDSIHVLVHERKSGAWPERVRGRRVQWQVRDSDLQAPKGAEHMTFQAPITIKEALDNIQGMRYAMPAIQREFVWSAEQIESLFDSLMRGFPIGAFLFWEVNSGTADAYPWLGFVRDYHQTKGRHNPDFEPLPDNNGLTAVLDGQQRLTALNIGLRGSYANKLPHFKWNNPAAFPEKHLYLNIDSWMKDDELDRRYEFKFLTQDDFEKDRGASKWFKVSDVMKMGTDPAAPFKYLLQNGLFNAILDDTDQQESSDRLDRLTQLRYTVHEYKPISYFLESENNLQKVLNIFVRTNSGGTELSNSDLLLSIAVAQFKELDARRAVHELIDELNEVGDGFNLHRDLILKAGLVLADINNIRFDIRNFNRVNIRKLEAQWEETTSAVRGAVELASSYGLSGRRLTSQNALLPIAYYLRLNNLGTHFLESVSYRPERDAIKGWLFRTLVARVWGTHSDALLVRLRSVIRDHGHGSFPVQELSTELAAIGRGIEFDDERLEDIIDTEYGGNAFVLLSMLYPFVDVANSKFHMDHVFPKSKFTRASLEKAGLSWDQSTQARERMNRLANLHLLPGPDNAAKRDKLPLEWLDSEFGDGDGRAYHVMQHDLGNVPGDLHGFVDWYDARRERMLDRLRGILGQRPS